MRLSGLQKYILIQTYKKGPKLRRSFFESFYKKPKDQEVKTITVSIERLIAKGLLKGYGYKTAEKLFIQSVSLTPKGRNQAKQLYRDGQLLPLKSKKCK